VWDLLGQIQQMDQGKLINSRDADMCMCQRQHQPRGSY
jgi:hypothetical protein